MSGFDINLNADQALAFIEALTGMEPAGNGQPTPKSPHAHTTLAAILGQTNVPKAGDIAAWSNGRSINGYPMRLSRFIQYLRAVADALETILPGEDRR